MPRLRILYPNHQMNRPSSENNQACLNCRVAREKESKTQSTECQRCCSRQGNRTPMPRLRILYPNHQMNRPTFQKTLLRDPLGAEGGGFEPPVREPVRQFSKLLVSATHPSFQKDPRAVNLGASPRLRVQRYYLFLNPPNFYATFFRKSYLNAITSLSSESRQKVFCKVSPSCKYFILRQ